MNPIMVMLVLGVIYYIRCKLNGKGYIGQTIGTMENRWAEHLQNARYLIRAKAGDPTINYDGTQYKNIRHSLLYNAMACHGIENFEVELVETVDDDELNEWEPFIIEEYGTLIPNGYNLTTGGDSFRHSDESKQLMRKVKLQNIDKNRHEILCGMPPYLSYGKDKRYEWILVQNHPLCKLREFTVQKYGSIDAVKNAVIEFLIELELSGKMYVKEKNGDLKDYPGLKETKKGYKIEKYIKKKKYHAGFESKRFTRDELKQQAIEWYKMHITPLLN